MKEKMIKLYQLKHERSVDDYITDVIESGIKSDEHTVSSEPRDRSLCDEYDMIKNKLIQRYVENHPEYDDKTVNDAVEHLVRTRDVEYKVYDWHDSFDDVDTSNQNANKRMMSGHKTEIRVLPIHEYEWGENKIRVNDPDAKCTRDYEKEIKQCYDLIDQIKDGYEKYNEWEKHKADLDIDGYIKEIQSLEISSTKEKTAYLLYDTNKDDFSDNQQTFDILCGYNDIVYSSAPLIHHNSEHDTYYICCDGEMPIPFDWINKKQHDDRKFDVELLDALRKAHDFNIVFDNAPIDIIERNFIYYARCRNIIVFVKHDDYIKRKKTIDDLKKNGLQ